MDIELMQTVLHNLKQIGAVKIDTRPGAGFRMKIHETRPDAQLSPIYLNLRTPENPKPGPLTKETIADIAEVLYRYSMQAEISYQGIAGIPNAGNPIAEAFAEFATLHGSEVPLLGFSKDEKDGLRRIGPMLNTKALPRGRKLLLIDDLATYGGSKDEALERAREAGYIVTDILVLVDRQQGALVELAEKGVSLHAAFLLSSMLQYYRDQGDITIPEYMAVRRYLDSNR